VIINVIHAESLEAHTTTQSLKSSMDRVFRLAREHNVRSIAIPAVGTGIAGFPMDECARAMASCLGDAFVGGWSPDEAQFVLLGEPAKQAFESPFVSAFGVI
jgi:O-acetyl-ADP-ribose deacetylase (regulator of RNase III)